MISEVKARTQAGNNGYFGVTKLLRTRIFSKKSENSNIPNACKTRGNVWVGNVGCTENGRELNIRV